MRLEPRQIHTSFAITSGLALLALLPAIGKEWLVSATLITIALIVCFWYSTATTRAGAGVVAAAQLLILFNAAGIALGLHATGFAGVTFDTYLHLLAAFVTTMVVAAHVKNGRHPLLLAAGATMLLGVGVEIVEAFDAAYLTRSGLEGCLASFCPYLQDTAKDLINDALGALLFVIAALTAGGDARRRR